MAQPSSPTGEPESPPIVVILPLLDFPPPDAFPLFPVDILQSSPEAWSLLIFRGVSGRVWDWTAAKSDARRVAEKTREGESDRKFMVREGMVAE